MAINKCCQNSEVFTEICIASRTKSKCDALKDKLQPDTKTVITTAKVDADNVEELVKLIESYKPEAVLNLALPAYFDYSWQWNYKKQFEEAGIMGLLGTGFDPGVTSVFSAYALKHYFDEIDTIDILDCNGGDHGYPFATNFNPEINLREVSAPGSYWEDGLCLLRENIIFHRLE